MRLHRFYIQTRITANTFDIADRDLVHQWKSVFRYNVGSQIILFDGSGTDFLCMINSLRNLGTTVTVMKRILLDTSIKRTVCMCMSLIKKDNFEFVVQKVTELGVSNIIPILGERSEKKKVNMERLRKIAVEASEQSGRGDILEIHSATTLKELFQTGVLSQEKIALHPEGMLIGDYVKNVNPSTITVFIGPEGGYSDDEIKFFKTYNVPIVSLGTQILRAETAAIAVASLMLI